MTPSESRIRKGRSSMLGCTSACQPRVPWSPAYIYTRGNGPGAHGEAAAAAATRYGCGLQLPGFLWLACQSRTSACAHSYYGVLKRSVQSASQCNPNAASQALPAKPPAPWPQDQSISAQACCSSQRDGNAEVSLQSRTSWLLEGDYCAHPRRRAPRSCRGRVGVLFCSKPRVHELSVSMATLTKQM